MSLVHFWSCYKSKVFFILYISCRILENVTAKWACLRPTVLFSFQPNFQSSHFKNQDCSHWFFLLFSFLPPRSFFFSFSFPSLVCFWSLSGPKSLPFWRLFTQISSGWFSKNRLDIYFYYFLRTSARRLTFCWSVKIWHWCTSLTSDSRKVRKFISYKFIFKRMLLVALIVTLRAILNTATRRSIKRFTQWRWCNVFDCKLCTFMYTYVSLFLYYYFLKKNSPLDTKWTLKWYSTIVFFEYSVNPEGALSPD